MATPSTSFSGAWCCPGSWCCPGKQWSLDSPRESCADAENCDDREDTSSEDGTAAPASKVFQARCLGSPRESSAGAEGFDDRSPEHGAAAPATKVFQPQEPARVQGLKAPSALASPGVAHGVAGGPAQELDSMQELKACAVLAGPPAASHGTACNPAKDEEDSASAATSDRGDALSSSCGSGEAPAAPGRQADWWRQADVAGIRSFQGISEISQLLNVRVVQHFGGIGKSSAPWSHGRSEELYKEMGVSDPEKSYVVCWLNLSDVSLLFVSEVTDLGRLQAALADNALGERLKFILNPVSLGVPCPAKGPRDAETVGAFFGHKGSSLVQGRTAEGAVYAVLQIDLHCKMLLRMMLTKVAFREGNVIEMLIADWPGRAVLASVRVTCTKQALELLR